MEPEIEHRLTQLETDSRALAKALELQRKETDRRLSELNGEAGRLRQIQERFTTAEKTDALDARVKILEGAQYAYAGRRETQTETTTQTNWDRSIVITIILAIAGVVATFLATHKF